MTSRLRRRLVHGQTERNELPSAWSECNMSDGTGPLNKSQGMAVSSLVLGILSFVCLGPLGGVPAIILGHKAYRRARSAPEQYCGEGLAITGLVLGYVNSVVMSIALVSILAGMLLPALAKAKGKAQSIACMNNLKQIGLAFRIWATDHQDRFPFNSATATNGSLQVEAVLDDPVRIFQVLSNELATPKILVCPGDGSKQPAVNFETLTASNLSYELDTSPDITTASPQEVLARCPVHGHELHCDGSVQQTRPWRR